ncbi:MAG: hypothetical protein AB1512_03000 [Thermodesulfobacteriota bacterium]
MKTFSLLVCIRAENREDLIERIEDQGENPIDEFNPDSIREVRP